MSTFPINPYVVSKIHVVYSAPGELNEKLLHPYPRAVHCAIVQWKDISAQCKLGSGYKKCWGFSPVKVNAALLQKRIVFTVGFTA